MTGSQPCCSVIVRAYNEERHIGRLLEGISQQTIQPEVILVDSGSTDATVAIARRFPRVRVVHIRPQDFTFGRALNLGIRQARSEFIVNASAHVYPVYPDWLERLLEPFADPRVAVTYGKQRGAPTTRFSEHQIFATWFPEGTSPVVQDHPFCNNANAALRRSLWEQHPYDESLPGLEDLAWAKWAMSQGYRVVYVPTAEIVHVHDEAPRQIFNRYRREAMAFKRLYPEAHFGLFDLMRLFVSNVISDWWHAWQQGRWPRVAWEVIQFRWWQFWGTYQGYRLARQPLTDQLRQTFYYPRGWRRADEPPRRDIAPIAYGESPQTPTARNSSDVGPS